MLKEFALTLFNTVIKLYDLYDIIMTPVSGCVNHKILVSLHTNELKESERMVLNIFAYRFFNPI